MKHLYGNGNNIDARIDIYQHKGKIYIEVSMWCSTDYLEIDPSGNVRELSCKEWEKLKTAETAENGR